MKDIYRIFSAAACALAIAGCAASLDSFDEKLDSLEGRITALESASDDLNASIVLLQSVASGYTVSSVDLKNGVYKIVLSNATEISLTAGAVPVAPAPVLTLSDDFYWKVDLQDGAGASYLLNPLGEKILAKGQNGIVPQFSVDASGYWTVSYDGVNFTQLKGSDGKPVKALESGDGSDKFFSAVSVEGEYLCLTTKDGKVYKAPIVPDFMFAIEGGDTPSVFNYGDVRQYTLTSKGVARAMVFAPAGWNAKIDGDNLFVTAPSGAVTKSTQIAGASSEVAVLAMSENGYATIAKVKVALAASVVPEAMLEVTEVGSDGATVKVTVNTMTGLYYKVQAATADAPTADEVVLGGTLTTEETIALTGLSMVSSYKIFAVPVNASLTGAMVSASFKTKDYADYLEAWNAGKEISICGIKYSKALNGAATSVVAGAAATSLTTELAGKSGVIMLEASEGASFKVDAVLTPTADLVLINRYPTKPVTVSFSASIKPDYYGIAAKGVKFDCCGFTAKVILFIGSGTPIQQMHFDSCQIIADQNQNFVSTGAENNCKSFRFYSNYIESRNTRYTFSNFSGNKRWCDVEEFEFVNNTVVCPSAASNNHDFSISATNNTAISGTDSGKRTVVRITNNTFYNAHGGFTYFGFNWVKSFTFSKNLACCVETAGTGNTSVLKLLATKAGQPCTPVVDMTDNIIFDSVKNWIEEISSSTNYSGTQVVIKEVSENPIPSPDFANRVFTPIDDYSAYGAQ